MCGGLSSDAKELDAQAGFEKAVTAVPLMQEGADIIYGVGATDAGSSISYAQMVLDDEIIAGLADELDLAGGPEEHVIPGVWHDRSVGARCGRIVRMRDGLIEDQEAGVSQEG